MKILHTSDWHLGRSLYGKKRYDEFESFLNWLIQTIIDKNINVLIISGDIFDSGSPSNKAQELYYKFLYEISKTSCKYVIAVAGNHDSPSFLNAPKELLKILNVYVVGSIPENIEDEVITIYKDNKPILIVCAVPYLRDKEIRIVEPGETIESKNQKLVEGIKNHYLDVVSYAVKIRNKFVNNTDHFIPIIATGHLFTTGGKTVDGDGVRELYVGTLSYVDENAFPAEIDYLALGHLHIPQTVGDNKHIRYSGSPIPMGFGEANQTKKLVLLEIKENKLNIDEISVPTFQTLSKISGDIEKITSNILKLKDTDTNTWLEIEYTGAKHIPDLKEYLEGLVEWSKLEILRIRNKVVSDKILSKMAEDEILEDLSPIDVFVRYLDAVNITEDREELITLYKEIVNHINEEDINAQ
jgi:exonuclease SbcD